MRLIDADALIEYCNNQKDKTISANDIARFPAIGGWISVKDKLPEKAGRYLVCAKEGEKETHKTIAIFQRSFHLNGRTTYWKVSHWMPLPEPPKEGKDNG